MRTRRRTAKRPNMKSQSLENHKEKWLARMTSPKAAVSVVQHLIMAKGGKLKCAYMISFVPTGKHVFVSVRSSKILPLNAMAFRALDALAAEGKIQTNMCYNEWQTQIALGTARRRDFYTNKVL